MALPLVEQTAASSLTGDELAYLFTDYLTEVIVVILYYRLGYDRLFHVNLSGYIEDLEAIGSNSSLSTCIYCQCYTCVIATTVNATHLFSNIFQL
ncbi:hypothetical protein XBJ2_2300011 [Xenorhabdus bovienii str. Jollieti]|nr:hypothetical protein XBJ2_2300011 [Xenorhabdus bovienii str. Jollieti]